MSLATRGSFRGCFSGTTTAVLRDPSPRALSVWRRVVKFLILWVDLFSKVVCVSQDLANQVRFCTEFQRCMKEGTAPRDAKYLRPPTAEYMSGEGFNAVFDLLVLYKHLRHFEQDLSNRPLGTPNSYVKTLSFFVVAMNLHQWLAFCPVLYNFNLLSLLYLYLFINNLLWLDQDIDLVRMILGAERAETILRKQKIRQAVYGFL